MQVDKQLQANLKNLRQHYARELQGVIDREISKVSKEKTPFKRSKTNTASKAPNELSRSTIQPKTMVSISTPQAAKAPLRKSVSPLRRDAKLKSTFSVQGGDINQENSLQKLRKKNEDRELRSVIIKELNKEIEDERHAKMAQIVEKNNQKLTQREDERQAAL